MRKKCKVGYKICMVKDGKYISGLIPNFNGIMIRNNSVEYKLNRCTKRNEGCGPLAVFDNIEDALSYPRRSAYDFKVNTKYVIFKCYYRESSDKMLWVNNKKVFKDYVPDGTAFADTVNLKEIVKEFYGVEEY